MCTANVLHFLGGGEHAIVVYSSGGKNKRIVACSVHTSLTHHTPFPKGLFLLSGKGN